MDLIHVRGGLSFLTINFLRCLKGLGLVDGVGGSSRRYKYGMHQIHFNWNEKRRYATIEDSSPSNAIWHHLHYDVYTQTISYEYMEVSIWLGFTY